MLIEHKNFQAVNYIQYVKMCALSLILDVKYLTNHGHVSQSGVLSVTVVIMIIAYFVKEPLINETCAYMT